MASSDRLLSALRRVHDGEPWHGPSRAQVLADVSAAEATWRPAPGVHTLWEIVLHMRSWTQEVLRRAEGGVPADPAEGDWPSMPSPADDAAWREAQRFLDNAHAALVRFVAQMQDDARAARVAERPTDPPGHAITQRAMIRSLAEHDVYHTGQLALLKRLARAARSP